MAVSRRKIQTIHDKTKKTMALKKLIWIITLLILINIATAYQINIDAADKDGTNVTNATITLNKLYENAEGTWGNQINTTTLAGTLFGYTNTFYKEGSKSMYIIANDKDLSEPETATLTKTVDLTGAENISLSYKMRTESGGEPSYFQIKVNGTTLATRRLSGTGCSEWKESTWYTEDFDVPTQLQTTSMNLTIWWYMYSTCSGTHTAQLYIDNITINAKGDETTNFTIEQNNTLKVTINTTDYITNISQHITNANSTLNITGLYTNRLLFIDNVYGLYRNVTFYYNGTKHTNQPYNIIIKDKGTQIYNIYANNTEQPLAYSERIFNITNQTKTTQQFTITPSQLLLQFEKKNVSTITEGVVIDQGGLRTRAFNDTNIVIVRADLSLGKVTVLFNYDINNWTQYYEFINTGLFYVAEELELVANDDVSVFLRIEDYLQQPIQYATVRISMVNTSTLTNNTIGLIGQRVTNEEGETFFFTEQTSYVFIQVDKGGYQTKIISFPAQDTSYSETNPYIIRLVETDTINNTRTWGSCQAMFFDRNEEVYCALGVYPGNSLTINTQYNNTQKTLNMSSAGWVIHELLPNADFNNASIEDIIIHLYVNGVYDSNRTIEYFAHNVTTIFDPDVMNLQQGNFLNIVILVALLILAFITTQLFNNVDIGFTVFGVGSIVATSLSGIYWVPSVIIGVYFLIRYLSKTFIKNE